MLPADVVALTSARYVSAFERITGTTFVPGDQPAAPRIARAVATLLQTSSDSALDRQVSS